MTQKQDITPTSQLARDEAKKLVAECVHDFLENRDELKAQALLEKARLCIVDAKAIENADRVKKLN